MAFRIKLENVECDIEKARLAALKNGEVFEGDNSKGRFYVRGVVGNYSVVSKNEVEISIERKKGIAKLVPDSKIEKEIKNFFSC